MGTTLTGTTPANTYDSLIKVTDNGPLSGTAKYLSDGLGNDSALALSTSAVGIGTTSPSNLLHLNKASEPELYIQDSVATFRLGLNSENQFFVYTAQAKDIYFSNNGSERMRITSAGNVGIGTSSPSGKLHIKGNILIERSSIAESSELTMEDGQFDIKAAPYNYSVRFFTGSGGSSSERMRIDSTGNVGIGTDSPTGKLHTILPAYTNEDTDSQHAIFGESSGYGVRIGYNVTSNAGYITALKPAVAWGNLVFQGSDIRMNPNGSEKARFTSNGLTFNGDTAAANALDDYEEGTWSPVITDGTNDATMIGGAGGAYTKIGRQVTLTGYVRTTSLGSVTGSIFIKNLPFSANASTAFGVSTAFGFGSGLNLTAGQTVGARLEGGTSIELRVWDDASGSTAMQASEWTADGFIFLSLTYFV